MYMYHGFYGFWWPIAAIIMIIPFWRICARVGLSPWLSLLLLIPLANLVFIYYVAFGAWPAEHGRTTGFGPRTGPGPTPT